MKADKTPGFVDVRVKDQEPSERSQDLADQYLLLLYGIARQLPQTWETLTKLDKAIGEYELAGRGDGYALGLQDGRQALRGSTRRLKGGVDMRSATDRNTSGLVASNCLLWPVFDNAMAGSNVKRGDRVEVARGTSWGVGDMVLVLVNGQEPEIRRVSVSGGSAVFRADDAAYPPIPMGEGVVVVGKVESVQFRPEDGARAQIA